MIGTNECITKQRWQPSQAGIADTLNGQQFERDYTPAEKMDLINWLNERERGYSRPAVGALKD